MVRSIDDIEDRGCQVLRSRYVYEVGTKETNIVVVKENAKMKITTRKENVQRPYQESPMKGGHRKEAILFSRVG